MSKSPTSKTAAETANSIPLSEYVARRERVLKTLDGAAAVVFASDPSGHDGRFRPDQHFYYLTGIANEPGAAVLFNPAADDPRRQIVLFLRPVNPEADRWERARDMVSEAMKKQLGFANILRTPMLGDALAAAARRTHKLACLHPFAGANAPVSADLMLYRKVTERVPGVAIEDATQTLSMMRAVKSDTELGAMRRAAQATAAGYAAVLEMLKPGVSERDIQRTLESAYLDAGAQIAPPALGGSAYAPIVGAGFNATVLHYVDNDATCQAGDLVLIDSGARVGGYCCDVSRTYPVSGKFTSEQRDLYEIVLKSMQAAFKATKPGTFLWEVDQAAREVIDKAGLADAFFHSIGHQLGLDVHDATPDGPLKAGMVITVEPGIYLPEKKIGIRIEDDLLVTARGYENLTEMIKK